MITKSTTEYGDPSTERFTKNVRAELKRQGMSLRRLCMEAQISYSTFTHVLAGRKGITVRQAGRVANTLGVPLSDLLEDRN